MVGFRVFGTHRVDRLEDMRRLAAQVLVASAQIPSLDVESVRSANPWVSGQDIRFFLEALGISDVQEPAAPEHFVLPGRPALETFFREYVIEPSADRARYEALSSFRTASCSMVRRDRERRMLLIRSSRRSEGPSLGWNWERSEVPSSIRQPCRCARRSNRQSAAHTIVCPRSFYRTPVFTGVCEHRFLGLSPRFS
jgi:hypothetical protein